MFALVFGRTLDVWGYIPNFLDENDPRPAREQFNERYRSGWLPTAAPGLKFDRRTLIMTSPGDPEFTPISAIVFRQELLVLYEGSFVVIAQPDGAWECARMD